MKLSPAGKKMLAKSRKLSVTAAANTKDLSNTRVQTSAPMLLRR